MERRWRQKVDRVREGKGVERREERAGGSNSEGAKIAVVLIHPPKFTPRSLRVQSDSHAGKPWGLSSFMVLTQ